MYCDICLEIMNQFERLKRNLKEKDLTYEEFVAYLVNSFYEYKISLKELKDGKNMDL